MRKKKDILFHCPSEEGFDAADGFCHLVIADRAWIYYTSGFQKLSLEGYLCCVLDENGYRSVIYRNYPEPDISEILEEDRKTALLILPDDWCSFADWAFGRMENGTIRMKYLRQADKERRLILVFAAGPGRYIPEQEPGSGMMKLLHIWRPEQLPSQQERKKWHLYLRGVCPDMPAVQHTITNETVQISEEEFALFLNMKTWSDHMRHDTYTLFEKNADILRKQLICMEELYQTEIQCRQMLWSGSTPDELKELSEMEGTAWEPGQKLRMLRVMEETDYREQLQLRRAVCSQNLQKLKMELSKNCKGGILV